MELQISTQSMTPIYEQIADQIRQQIREKKLKSQELLPSVRACARDYHISALTVKKAYDLLENEGFVVTVHGKGTYVTQISENEVQEEMQRQIEQAFEIAIDKALSMKMSEDEIVDLVRLLVESHDD